MITNPNILPRLLILLLIAPLQILNPSLHPLPNPPQALHLHAPAKQHLVRPAAPELLPLMSRSLLAPGLALVSIFLAAQDTERVL